MELVLKYVHLNGTKLMNGLQTLVGRLVLVRSLAGVLLGPSVLLFFTPLIVEVEDVTSWVQLHAVSFLIVALLQIWVLRKTRLALIGILDESKEEMNRPREDSSPDGLLLGPEDASAEVPVDGDSSNTEQHHVLVARTLDAATVTMSLESSEKPTLPLQPGGAYLFQIVVMASGGNPRNEATWRIRGIIECSQEGHLMLLGAPIGVGTQPTHHWNVDIDADDISRPLAVQVTGGVAEKILWRAHLVFYGRFEIGIDPGPRPQDSQ